MSVSEFLTMFYLHDSGVDWLRHSTDNEQLVLKITLSNWMQDWFVEGNPEQIPGILVFSGASRLKSNHDWRAFVESENMSMKFLDATYVPSQNIGKLQASKIVISVFDHQTRTEEILILEFLAQRVEWMPRAEGSSG